MYSAPAWDASCPNSWTMYFNYGIMLSFMWCGLFVRFLFLQQNFVPYFKFMFNAHRVPMLFFPLFLVFSVPVCNICFHFAVISAVGNWFIVQFCPYVSFHQGLVRRISRCWMWRWSVPHEHILYCGTAWLAVAVCHLLCLIQYCHETLCLSICSWVLWCYPVVFETHFFSKHFEFHGINWWSIVTF